jgi:integrase
MARQPRPWRRGGPEGPWYAQVAGRKVRLADPSATKDEAHAALYRILSGADAGPAPTGSPLVREVINVYLDGRYERAALGKLSPEAWKNLWHRLRLADREFGETPAAELTGAAVQRWLDRQDWSSSYQRAVVSDLQFALRQAVGSGQLDRDPLAGFKRPPATRREFDADASVRERFLAACNEPYKTFVRLVIDTGCRPIEIARLTAGDFDRESGTLRIANKTARTTGRRLRTVYLTETARGLISELAGRRPDGPLLLNARGRPWRMSAWNEACRNIRDRAGLPREFVLYDLRHAYATDAIEAGVNPFVLAELMGHSNPMMLLKHYSKIVRRRAALMAAVAQIRPPSSPAAPAKGPAPAQADEGPMSGTTEDTPPDPAPRSPSVSGWAGSP